MNTSSQSTINVECSYQPLPLAMRVRAFTGIWFAAVRRRLLSSVARM